MEIEYIATILPDGHLSIDPIAAKKFKRGERIRVRLSTLENSQKTYKPSRQALKLIELLENASDRGGFGGKEISRGFIHERTK